MQEATTDTSSADLCDLLARWGPQAGPVEQILFDPEGPCWTIEFDDDEPPVWAEPAGDPQRLVLQASLGAPHPQDKARVHELVLMFSALWQETGGARIGLAGEDGELLLIADLQGPLDVSRLQHEVLAFHALAADWRRFVAAPGSAPSPALGIGLPAFQQRV